MQQQDDVTRQQGGDGSAVADQARELARAGTEQVKQIGQTAKDRAFREIDAKRERFASEVEKLAGTLESQRDGSEGAGPILDLAASAARRLSTALKDRSAEELLQGVAKNPVAILAGAFALGFVATRLFKA
ncbi:MAG: hypothetical protein LC689_06040 [Myxococcales bacterium]|nr:hypothetical protein [Myxococcales bacterium]